MISFRFNAFLCICCVIYSVYAVLKLIEKHIFLRLNDILLADVPVLAELQVICLNVYVEFSASMVFKLLFRLFLFLH